MMRITWQERLSIRKILRLFEAPFIKGKSGAGIEYLFLIDSEIQTGRRGLKVALTETRA